MQEDFQSSAVSFKAAQGLERPLVLDSPHSGREYPSDFRPIISQIDLHRVEDSFVDLLVSQAPQLGAGLLVANFPRTYIDPNRAIDDIDPSLIDGRSPVPPRPSEKSRLGHGLIWKTYPPNRPMYGRKLSPQQVTHRIETFWRPYHSLLEAEIYRLQTLFGQVWHLNCHSMPSTSSPFLVGQYGKRADFVLGDLDGRSCSREFTNLVQGYLEKKGYGVVLNNPYKGAELVRAYSNPAHGRHSLQIEINRAIYMNETYLEPNDGFTSLQADLGELVTLVGDYGLAQVGMGNSLAAE